MATVFFRWTDKMQLLEMGEDALCTISVTERGLVCVAGEGLSRKVRTIARRSWMRSGMALSEAFGRLADEGLTTVMIDGREVWASGAAP